MSAPNVGLFNEIKRVGDRYGKPMMITENGIATPDDATPVRLQSLLWPRTDGPSDLRSRIQTFGRQMFGDDQGFIELFGQ